LHYHFRSEHPALIAYSNEHFYNNELVAFPSVSQEQMPIKFHEVKNGIYSNRTNEQEAKKVADHLASLLGNKSEKIGLVAFSETQLESIFQQLNAADRIRLLTRIDEDSLFFKALEQVQGDECDRLIISFGYAKNENGQFEMRFGPVNEKNGSKRLNVLFSRARKNIDFFASVNSEDFALSSNNSIRLLWRWFVFIEREQLKQNEVVFPFECTISQKKNLLSMADWSDLSSNANDMLTIIRTLKMRGWQLGIT
jgi:superfamily I DNA and/or RNA helicase